MKHLTKTAKFNLDSYFKRINFTYHVVPTAITAVNSNHDLYHEHGHEKPNIYIPSKNMAFEIKQAKEEIWTNSITISIGSQALPIEPIIRVKSRTKILSEDGATLVLSQCASGGVIALIYPPKSLLLSSQLDCYVFERWDNPLEITHKSVSKSLDFLYKLNSYTSTCIYPNPIGIRLMTKLQARDEVFRNGGSRIWVWFRYLIKSIQGIARVYGIGTPVK
jgi:hypothetical protein